MDRSTLSDVSQPSTSTTASPTLLHPPFSPTSFFSRPSSNLNREPSSDSSLSTSASADSSSSSNASEDPELATPPSEPQQEAVYTCSCEEAEKVEGDVDTTGLSSDTSLTTLDLSTSSCGRKERRHYRSTKVLEFEGRHSPGQVWICSKKPRSPMPGWITPADMKTANCYFATAKGNNDQNSSFNDPAAQSSSCYLGHRPHFIHSETVPDVQALVQDPLRMRHARNGSSSNTSSGGGNNNNQEEQHLKVPA